MRMHLHSNFAIKTRPYNTFWRDIKKYNNGRCNKYASTVGGCTGEDAIAEMWRSHFKELFYSDNAAESKDSVLSNMNIVSSDNTHTVTVEDINTACKAAKIGKTAGSDGVSMEAFVNGGPRLRVHLALLFNMPYLP